MNDPPAVFAVISAALVFLVLKWRIGWRGTLLLTLPCWIVLNLLAAVMFRGRW